MKKTQVGWLFIGLCFAVFVRCSQDDPDADYVMVPASIEVKIYQGGKNITEENRAVVQGWVEQHLNLEREIGPAIKVDHILQDRLTETIRPVVRGAVLHFNKDFILFDMGPEIRSLDDRYAGILSITLDLFFNEDRSDRVTVKKTYPYG